LYTGVTTDPVRRLKQHNAGTGARYTRARLPVTLVYLEEAAGRGEALKREHAIKKLTRSQKLGLIKKYSSPIKNQNGLKD
jgi:putative endonuclease